MTGRMLMLGNGSWGSATAMILAENGYAVDVWGRDADAMAAVQSSRRNDAYLPEITLPDTLRYFSGAPDFAAYDAVIVAIPTQHIRPALSQWDLSAVTRVVVLSKGIEEGTHLGAMDVVQALLPHAAIAGLYGPSHAEEVARGLPASLVAVSSDGDFAEEVQRWFMNAHLRVYVNTDVVGVQLGAALKNVIGLAAGICDGMGLGDNAKSALLVRGLREIERLGVKLGANPHTFAGLSGMGDLLTTCFSQYGRNRAVGLRLGQGEALDSILSSMKQVAEGVPTTRATLALAAQHGVDMPITTEVAAMAFNGKSPRKALQELMLRDPKDEA